MFELHPARKGHFSPWERGDDGTIYIYAHEGQVQAWESEARVTAVIAGTQGGKTSFGPLWLLREIQRRGPGDYGVVTTTTKLLERAVLKHFLRLFRETLKLGSYNKTDRVFTFSPEGARAVFGDDGGECSVYFGYATNPEGLESATWKAVWLDEAGQKHWKQDSFEAIQRRLAVHDGRILITTTPYNLGWLKTEVWDHADGVDIVGIRFDSTTNPAFDPRVMERQKKKLPTWKFEQFYRGIFTRAAGSIFDNWNDKDAVCADFNPPNHWYKVWGFDFGPINFAAVCLCRSPKTGRWYVYKTYHPGQKRTEDQHIAALMRGEDVHAHDYSMPMVVGGAPSEDEWRAKFAAAGLPVARPSQHGVDTGISAIYSMIATFRLWVMAHKSKLRAALLDYSYETDADGNAIEGKIADKSTWHLIDALRYAALTIEMHRELRVNADTDDQDFETEDDLEVTQAA